MLSQTHLRSLLPRLLHLAVDAGRAILVVYESDDFQTQQKEDESPLTLADRKSHEILDAGLRRLTPEVPILSEEGRSIPYEERAGWEELWLVDPLDGTKEFIKRNGEFTVNIALVQHGEPVAGVIYAPVRDEAWLAVTPRRGTVPSGEGRKHADVQPLAHKLLSASAHTAASSGAAASAGNGATSVPGTPIRVRTRDPRAVSVIASRTHMNPETQAFIDRISAEAGPEAEVEIVNVGSSLKLCYVAEGRADLYPRYAPTSEWDTAAGHAIVRAAGGEIYQAGPDAVQAPGASLDASETPSTADHGAAHTPFPLRYNKENLLNPWFVVRAW